jgi:hypothetical protein
VKSADGRWERTKIALMNILAVISIIFGVTSTGWMIGMIHQWLIPWSSLAIIAHPP